MLLYLVSDKPTSKFLKSANLYAITEQDESAKTKSTLPSKFTGCQNNTDKMKNNKYITLDHAKCCDSDEKTSNELKTTKPIYDSFYDNSKKVDELNRRTNMNKTFNDNLKSTSLTTSVSPIRLKPSKKLDSSCTKINYASNQFMDSFGESSVGKLKLYDNSMWSNLIQNIKYFCNRCIRVIRCRIFFNKL